MMSVWVTSLVFSEKCQNKRGDVGSHKRLYVLLFCLKMNKINEIRYQLKDLYAIMSKITI